MTAHEALVVSLRLAHLYVHKLLHLYKGFQVYQYFTIYRWYFLLKFEQFSYTTL